MDIITALIEEIANLVSHRFYLSCFHDKRKKNDLRARMISEIQSKERELIRENEEALRVELAEEIFAVRIRSPLERVALYSSGPRFLVALVMVNLLQ